MREKRLAGLKEIYSQKVYVTFVTMPWSVTGGVDIPKGLSLCGPWGMISNITWFECVCYFVYINQLAYLFVSFVTMPWSVTGGIYIPKRTFFVGALFVLFSSWRFTS